MKTTRLGVNIDHVATLRNARNETYPDLLRAVTAAEHAGADGITMHLREDRRHIRDDDLYAVKAHTTLPLNMEMAATQEMLSIALDLKPHACCIVPEKREELTTEGGLNVISQKAVLAPIIHTLHEHNIRVSLFIDPEIEQLEAAAALHADIVELHTGEYCNAAKSSDAELKRIQKAASHSTQLNIECHAGHGLNYDNITPIAAIKELVEFNIGHFLVAESLFCGFEPVIRHMSDLIHAARSL